MKTRACTFPTCPPEALCSPWEPDEVVEGVASGLSPGQCTRLQVPRRSLDFAYSTSSVPRRKGGSEHHVLVVLAAERPEGSTLDATMASLRRGGSDRWEGAKVLTIDGHRGSLGGEEHEASGWLVLGRRRGLGSARAFVELLRTAVDRDPQVEHLTYVEDDVEVCAGFLDYARTVDVPDDVAFVSWFTYDYDWSSPPRCAGPHPSSASGPVLACRPSRFFILAQACTFPRRTVDLILRCPAVSGDSWPSLDGQDLMVGWALGDALYAVHFPILVQHRGGGNSAVRLAGGRAREGIAPDPQDGERTSPYYVGASFDAMTLVGGRQ